MNPIYRIYRHNNYVYIYDQDNDKLYQEHSFRVLVKKDVLNGEMYNISFLRPETTPGAFYTINWNQLVDINANPFPSQADWELWYQDNTGDIGTTATVTGGGATDCGSAVTTLLCDDQFIKKITPGVLIQSGTTGSIGIETYSASFASNGSADALVSFDGGSNYVAVPSGTTLNMTAGTLGWYYASDVFKWDTTTSGASLIITYNS